MGTTRSRAVQTSAGPVRIRVGVVEDAPVLLEHRRHMAMTSVHNVMTLDEMETDETKIREWIADHERNAGWLFVVADQPEAASPEGARRVLGALNFRTANRRRVQHHGEFGISVVEDWRGKGIGRALIETLIEWGEAHEFIEKIYLGVFVNNLGARRLYHSLGFRKEAVRPHYIKMESGEYIDDILMYRWVKPRPPDTGGA